MQYLLFAVAVFFVVTSTPVEVVAQSADGWWSWALPAVAEENPTRASRERARLPGRTGTVGRSGEEVERGGQRAERHEGRSGQRGQAGAQTRQRQERAGQADTRGRQQRTRGQGQRRGKGVGPPFCQNGQGHPVHGPQWCIEKGFGLGSGTYGRRSDRQPRWEWGGVEDIILRPPRTGERQRRYGELLDIEYLADVLGGRAIEQLLSQAQPGNDRLQGRWIRPTDGAERVLQIRAGNVPVAEFTDSNGDGAFDAVLLNQHR